MEGVGEPLARQDSGPPQGAGNPLRRHVRQHKPAVGDGNSDGLLSPGVHEDYVVDAGRENSRHRTDLPPARGALHRRKALVGHHVGHSPRKLVGPPARNTQRGMFIQHDGDDVEPHRREGRRKYRRQSRSSLSRGNAPRDWGRDTYRRRSGRTRPRRRCSPIRRQREEPTETTKTSCREETKNI